MYTRVETPHGKEADELVTEVMDQMIRTGPGKGKMRHGLHERWRGWAVSKRLSGGELEM